jgi:flagellar basal body-associated protein FliL
LNFSDLSLFNLTQIFSSRTTSFEISKSYEEIPPDHDSGLSSSLLIILIVSIVIIILIVIFFGVWKYLKNKSTRHNPDENLENSTNSDSDELMNLDYVVEESD